LTNRLPFTGINETSTRTASGGPHEGGGQLPPYGEDPFQRIVDVNWVGGGSGGVFIAGDVCCFFRYCKTGFTLDQTWHGLGSLDFGDGGGHNGCSYGKVLGKPVFLMCGGSGFKYGGLIMTSHDGLNWLSTLFLSANYIPDVVFNPKEQAFYANTNSHETYRSFDGYSWTSIGFDQFFNHCPLGIPDGTIGVDPVTRKSINPLDVTAEASGIYARVTAYMGGVWMAGGGDAIGPYRSAIASSVNAGKTWQPVTSGPIGMHGDYIITCMIGAPIGDIR
jgi:hypothetical protein